MKDDRLPSQTLVLMALLAARTNGVSVPQLYRTLEWNSTHESSKRRMRRYLAQLEDMNDITFDRRDDRVYITQPTQAVFV